MCFTCLVPYALSCLKCLVPYELLCPTCLVPYLLSCPPCSHALHRALWTPVFHVPCALCSLVSCALWSLFPYVPYCFLTCVLYVLYHHFCTWGSISRKHLTLLFFCSFAICDFLKIIARKFCILNPNKSRVIYPRSLR